MPKFDTRSSPFSRIPIQYRRYVRPALALSAIALIIWIFSGPAIVQRPSVASFHSSAGSSHPIPHSSESHTFWEDYAFALAKGKPTFEMAYKTDKEGKEMHVPWLMWNPMSDAERPDILNISQAERLEIASKHTAAVHDFGNIAPRLPFVKGTRGIVTTAGNDALPILTASLRMLRNAGSTLPVEILVGSYDDYEKAPCEEIFPTLGAKCIVMSDFLPEEMEHPITINHKFEFKVYAILMSSFEQVMFLDCDLFPVMNPDNLFVTEPFLSQGWIIWPDFWASTVSRHYYEMLDKTTPNITQRASAETGALVINKRTHGAAILLAGFYNCWGEKHYWYLFSQGATGMGDKDTFAPAIEAFDLPFYQVRERPERVGYRCNGMRRSVGSGQAHPHDDWVIASNGVYRNMEEDVYIVDAPDPRILFLHGNLPKYDFSVMLEWENPDIDWLDMRRCDKGEGEVHRMWGPKETTVLKFGWDVEKALWDAMRWTACEHEFDYRFWVSGSWHSKPKENVCSRAVAFYNELFPHETYIPDILPPHKDLQFGFQDLAT